MSADSASELKGLVSEARKNLAESSANFDANAILRGAQLTIVGGLFSCYARTLC
jgi:hypothetical protein